MHNSPRGLQIVFGALLAVAVVSLGGHALWLHLRLEQVKASRADSGGFPATDGALQRIAALEARIRGDGPGAAPAAAPREESAAARAELPAAKEMPRIDGGDAEILERLQLLEAAVLGGLGYSFDAAPGPGVVDVLLKRPFDGSEASRPESPAYAPEQLIGPPDAIPGRSNPSAWCSLEADSGFEWIAVHFETREVPRAVLVRETFSAGAVIQVEAEDASGQYRVVWGAEPNLRRRPGDFVVVLPPDAFPTRALRITLDSAAVPGWNEIDAVGLITEGGIHWAVSAAASSVWGGGHHHEVLPQRSE